MFHGARPMGAGDITGWPEGGGVAGGRRQVARGPRQFIGSPAYGRGTGPGNGRTRGFDRHGTRTPNPTRPGCAHATGPGLALVPERRAG
ncbi:hypothetical protein BX257_4490 [Streptomyces sp. 3212.3]|nr:hypothetical protein BX257_4490 [Streptomyces sp. 3212.3]